MAGMSTWKSSDFSSQQTRANNNDSKLSAQQKNAKKSDNDNARTFPPSGSATITSSSALRVRLRSNPGQASYKTVS